MTESSCPFCGSTRLQASSTTYPRVTCLSCYACGPYETAGRGCERWNARADLGETVNAAWRKANLLGVELAEERVISEARERANVAARERIAELEAQVLSLTGQFAGGKGP